MHKRTHEEMSADSAINNHGDDVNDATEAANDGRIEPYNAVERERLPESPVYTEDYKELKQASRDLVEVLLDPIRQTTFRNGVIDGLLEEISQRTKGEFPEEVRIALIGDMKTGKSSVINSILSVGMIARQGDAGNSCTWVVQEFCHTLPKQTMSFAAEIHFFTHEERQTIIRALLADFFRASSQDDDPASGSKDSDQAAEDYTAQQTTITAFKALFSTHKQFKTKSAAHDFLGQAQAEDDEDILSVLFEWTDELMTAVTKDGVVMEQASTTQTLLWEIAPFMFTVEERDGEPITSLWPFVSHIKFGLENKLLKHNITLVDLPGLSDANKTRVGNAMNHLRQCTHYMIVAEIGRASDDKFVRDHLSRGCFTRGQGRTMLVLTHADSIDEATAVSGSPKEMEKISCLQGTVCALDAKRREVVSKIRSTKPPLKYQYMFERDQIDDEMRQAQAQEQELRIGLRSKGVEMAMKELYGQLTSDPTPLPVFCVGNAAYRKHQAGYSTADSNPPTLSVQATNIPKLREHLLLAPAEGKLNETRHHVSTQLPALLSCFKLYTSKTHMARKDEIEEIVTEPQRTAPKIIDKVFAHMYERVEENILEPFMSDEFDWVDEARKLCKQWVKQYDTNTHLGMLKKEGIRKGRGKNATVISWNEELLAISTGEIQKYFRDCAKATDGHGAVLNKELNGLITRMMNKIRNDPQVTLMALKPFLDYLEKEKPSIRPMMDKTFRAYRSQLSTALFNAGRESPQNHLVKAMVPVYAKAAGIKGKKGTPKERCAEFEKMVTEQSGVWLKAHDGIRAEFKCFLNEQQTELKKQIQRLFVGIDKRFSMICSDDEKETEEETALREELQKKLVLAEEKLTADVIPRLEACLGKSAAAGFFVD